MRATVKVKKRGGKLEHSFERGYLRIKRPRHGKGFAGSEQHLFGGQPERRSGGVPEKIEQDLKPLSRARAAKRGLQG
jgi:hypothetical protein